jgi:hypothetical protein
MKARKSSCGKQLYFFFNLNAWWGGGWSTPRPGGRWEKDPVPFVQEAGWLQGRSERVRKISPPTGIRSPDTDKLFVPAWTQVPIRCEKTAESALVQIRPLYADRRDVLQNSEDAVRPAPRQKVFQKDALHMLLPPSDPFISHINTPSHKQK